MGLSPHNVEARGEELQFALPKCFELKRRTGFSQEKAA